MDWKQDFSVLGNTSNGVFVKGSKKGVFFISNSQYRGPLTINPIKVSQDIFTEIQIGTNVIVNPPTGIRFNDLDLVVDIRKAVIWQPEEYLSDISASYIICNLNNLVCKLIETTKTDSFSKIVSEIIEKETYHIMPGDKISLRLLGLYSSLKECNLDQFLQYARGLIGYGQGLTPSGDDFLSGMALGVARYSKSYPKFQSYYPWFDSLLFEFQQKTTILSGGLFHASLQGSADERIIDAFDQMMSKSANIPEVISKISTWGSSSGYDTMAGFLLIMKAILR